MAIVREEITVADKTAITATNRVIAIAALSEYSTPTEREISKAHQDIKGQNYTRVLGANVYRIRGGVWRVRGHDPFEQEKAMKLIKKVKQESKEVKIEISNTVINGIHSVWQEIGYECQQLCVELGEPINNETALEQCIDANYLTTHGHEEADDEVGALLKKHSYEAVMKALNSKIKLVY